MLTSITAIDARRLANLKPSFATRRVDHRDIAGLEEMAGGLRPGDLVIAQITGMGQHVNIERPDGRKAKLFPGDEILVACGARYAPDQFEADCPESAGLADLVAAGGIVGHVQCAHQRMNAATQVMILGAVCDRNGKRLNLADYAVQAEVTPITIPVIAVCGTAMNAGKTYTVATTVRGLARAGKKVAAIKVTGTGAGGDLWFCHDSGADIVRDFTDAGFATTYRHSVDEILTGALSLMAEAQAAGCDVIVIEVADGLRQAETAGILQSKTFRDLVSGVIFAAGDAMGAESGVAWLRRAGHHVLAVSGLLTRSPLAVREAETVIDLPCLTPDDLLQSETVVPLVHALARLHTVRMAA